MPSLHTENSEKWKNLASIDYFTQFIKAWIAFNAWYRNYYERIENDRDAINEIKANPNSFRNKLISLLNDKGNDGNSFRARIAELHLELERKHIFNKGDRITFEKLSIENNPTLNHSFSRNHCKYEVKRGIPNRKGEIDIFIYGKNSRIKFSYTQIGFDTYDLICNSEFFKLSESQQSNLKACYEEINPSKPISLLIQDHRLIREIKQDEDQNNKIKRCIEMGNLLFINDPDKLCKGIIEILYKLRNVLFHGEIIPDSDTNRVYEPAYQILYALIQAL